MDNASASLLASARRSKGLSVEFAARKLLLSTAQVRALGQGDSRAFYNQWFYQQALRNYAQYLEVPARRTCLP
ncbi:MAG: helix-turn-helix domain-containing protein [Acidimicrobiia bacterium]|nr:helix-turn-helix domain-containing protein [Acidimicrobiia bacterium]